MLVLLTLQSIPSINETSSDYFLVKSANLFLFIYLIIFIAIYNLR